MLKHTSRFLSLLFILYACHPSGSGDTAFNPNTDRTPAPAEAYDIIYSLELPTDIVRLFEETGTGFDPDLLLPLDRVPVYEDPEKIALLMGSLGVDLSYCKLFERITESAECYIHIELLADKIDLPQEIFDRSTSGLEHYIHKPDSLTELIDQVFSDVDNYFKEHDQEQFALLSLLGGWLETMYIGVKIFQDQSILVMGERILQQKYALNDLAGLLGDYQESLMIRRFMHPLNRLREAYGQVEIRYEQEGFELDETAGAFRAGISEIRYEPDILETICQIIIRAREELLQ